VYLDVMESFLLKPCIRRNTKPYEGTVRNLAQLFLTLLRQILDELMEPKNNVLLYLLEPLYK
ncbi:hypothetical protein ACQP3F_34375, partial [Escherichia coli]